MGLKIYRFFNDYLFLQFTDGTQFHSNNILQYSFLFPSCFANLAESKSSGTEELQWLYHGCFIFVLESLENIT